MKKTAAFLTAVFASLAMTAGASAQNIVNDVVDGAEDIVNGDATPDDCIINLRQKLNEILGDSHNVTLGERDDTPDDDMPDVSDNTSERKS